MIVAGTHSRAWSCAWMRTPGFVPLRYLPIRSARTVNGPRAGSPAGAPVRFTLRKSVSATVVAVGCTMPVPALLRYGCERAIRPPDWARIAAATWAAVLVSAPVEPVARLTVMAFPRTRTESGELATPGFTKRTVMSLPPSCPQAADVTTTAA